MDSVYEKFYESPNLFLKLCLGDGREGSVLQYLKNKQWANEVISAFPLYDLPEFNLFEVCVDLTPEGLKNWESIVKIIYQYIEKMKKITPQRWQEMFDEVSSVCVCVCVFFSHFFCGAIKQANKKKTTNLGDCRGCETWMNE